MSLKSKPVFVLTPVRNEIHNLQRTLPTWELIADKIIVIDQQSTDGTLEFLKSREKVIVVDNPDKQYDETSRRRLLVDAVRRISQNAIHLNLDADEILTSNVLDSPEWRSFRGSEPGTVGVFPWVQLWTSASQYIARGTGGVGPYRIAFVDDGRPLEGEKKIHEQRGVGVQHPKNIFVFNEVACLHYAWVNLQAGARRNNFYKVLYALRGDRSFHINNRNHGWYRSVRSENLAPSPANWLAGYRDLGMDVTSIGQSDLYWWDIEVLRAFSDHGADKFYKLDIWRDVDWEQLRQLALSRGYSGLGTSPIIPPGKWRRLFHKVSVDGVAPREIVRSTKRFVAARVLP